MAQISSNELLEKQFKKSFRGYDPVEVTSVLRDAAGTIEDLQEENASLRNQVEVLTREVERYDKLQESLNAALITAQKSAEETRAAAKQEADAMIHEAKAKAKEILVAVRLAIRKTEDELALVRQDKARFLIDYEALLRAHLDWVQSRPKDSEEKFGETLDDETAESENRSEEANP